MDVIVHVPLRAFVERNQVSTIAAMRLWVTRLWMSGHIGCGWSGLRAPIGPVAREIALPAA
jgi:hypothetical protein